MVPKSYLYIWSNQQVPVSQYMPTLIVHDIIHTTWSLFLSGIFILTSLNDAWTPVLMLHLTNPCTKQKVLSQTKPKGKIYKTKSLGHYITTVSQYMPCFFKTSFSPMFFSIILTSAHQSRWFLFLSIYGQQYPTFLPQFNILPFNILLALLLVGGISHLCILYHNFVG